MPRVDVEFEVLGRNRQECEERALAQLRQFFDDGYRWGYSLDYRPQAQRASDLAITVWKCSVTAWGQR